MDIPRSESRVKWSGGQRRSSTGMSASTLRVSEPCESFFRECEGATEGGLLDRLRPSRLRIQSGICAAAQSVTSLFTLDPDPLPSFSFSTRGTHSPSLLPTRSPFFAASIKGQRGKTTSLCWSCGSMSRGLRSEDVGTEQERVTDCFDGQTLRFFPSPHSILLFAPEIRPRLFLFHRPSILP